MIHDDSVSSIFFFVLPISIFLFFFISGQHKSDDKSSGIFTSSGWVFIFIFFSFFAIQSIFVKYNIHSYFHSIWDGTIYRLGLIYIQTLSCNSLWPKCFLPCDINHIEWEYYYHSFTFQWVENMYLCNEMVPFYYCSSSQYFGYRKHSFIGGCTWGSKYQYDMPVLYTKWLIQFFFSFNKIICFMFFFSLLFSADGFPTPKIIWRRYYFIFFAYTVVFVII